MRILPNIKAFPDFLLKRCTTSLIALLLTTFHCSAIKDMTKEVSQLLLGTNQFDFGQDGTPIKQTTMVNN